MLNFMGMITELNFKITPEVATTIQFDLLVDILANQNVIKQHIVEMRGASEEEINSLCDRMESERAAYREQLLEKIGQKYGGTISRDETKIEK